jgi:hypothetical protein
MPRMFLTALAVLVLTASGGAQTQGQQDPVAGNWRGTFKSTDGTSTPIIITIVRAGEAYAASTTGVGENSESPLQKVTVSGTRVTLEGLAESKLGPVAFGAELTAEGNTLRGAGTVGVGNQRISVTYDLQRRMRQDVVQPRVPQRVEYFTGRWKFEYIGGEFPPLSVGERSGTATFSTSGGSSFVTGTTDSQVLGKPFQEIWTIGVNPETKMVVHYERRPGGIELVSLGNWTSPLAITFQTTPLRSNGRVYQLRRVMSVVSATAFDVTEEFSIDGGPFRRLGAAHFTREP